MPEDDREDAPSIAVSVAAKEPHVLQTVDGSTTMSAGESAARAGLGGAETEGIGSRAEAEQEGLVPAMASLRASSDPIPGASGSAGMPAATNPVSGSGGRATPASGAAGGSGSSTPRAVGGATKISGLGGMKGGSGAGGPMKVPPTLAAKMAAMTNRHAPAVPVDASNFRGGSPARPLGPGPLPGAGGPAGLGGRSASGPAGPAGPGGMAGKRNRPGLKLSDMMGGGGGPSSPSSSDSSSPASAGLGRMAPPNGSGGSGRRSGAPKLGGLPAGGGPASASTPFSNFSKIVDPSGRLRFGGKAVLHAKGVDFSNGSSFAINMDELELLEELGKGNYGTVQKVFHKPTKVIMAMKEIRLELDDSKLKAILTELDILHRATSDTIVEFYGAFFIESCVYYCMEFMDAGSLDKLAGADVPEEVLGRVTGKVVEGLRFLKDELQTMHRDVKPTNILINHKGEVKLCDFGVSGQLERSLAKTNIGCQSYMAPERIQGEHQGQVSTYTVSSDVWSLGLTLIEFALGHYPFPPETYSNIFAQLTAIVHGDPPTLPESYSLVAQAFVAACLIKAPEKRPSYAQLLEHPFLVQDRERGKTGVDMKGWVAEALTEVKRKKDEERDRLRRQREANGIGEQVARTMQAGQAGETPHDDATLKAPIS